MDRHHQSTQAQDHHHHHSKNNRKTSREQRHRHREPLAESHNNVRRRPILEDNPMPSLISRSNNPLSEERDYVLRWLVGLDSGKENQASRGESRLINVDSGVDSRAGGKSSGNPRLRHPFEQQHETKHTATRKRRNSSSDSSILEFPIIPRVHSAKDEHYAWRNDVDDQHQSGRNKKKRVRPSSSESSLPSVRHETFEKRARHKTREDRYEPKRDKMAKEHGEEKRPSKKRMSKTDRSKATKKAGEDLMRKFSSKSIGQERLTMRPSQSLGLFNNGRASSPAQRKGIPDLAFSEMEFLQHSYRHAPAERTQNSKSRTKSREKGRKKLQRAHEEIAEFFQPNRSVLQEIGGSGDPKFSKYRQEKESIQSWQDDERNKHTSQSQSSRHPPDEHAERRTNSRVIKSPSSQIPSSYQAPLPTRTPRPPTSDSKQSGDGNSYISWSKSQRTQASRSNGQMPSNIRSESPTPDYIQRSIEKTGIFRDTGISGSPRPRSSEESASTRYRSTEITNVVGSENIPSHKSEKMLLDYSATPSSVRIPRATRDNSRGTNHGNVLEARLLPNMRRTMDRKSSISGESQSQHRVQDFDPKVGWQRNSDNRSPPVENQVEPQISELTTAERAAIAKDARIRPSSTLSAIRAVRNSLNYERANMESQAVKHSTPGNAANHGLVAGDSAKMATESNMNSRGESILQTAETLLEQSERVSAAPDILQYLNGGLQAGPVIQEKPTAILLEPSTEHRLQTPASAVSRAVPEYRRAECISHLGLPVREPSVVHHGPSPSMPSRFTPITDPLFIRQLSEANRGDDFHERFSFHQEQVTPSYAAHYQTSLHTAGDIDMEHHEEEMFDQYRVEDNDFEGSYAVQLPYQPYRAYDDAQPYEAERSWRPDLTPIREQSDEYEHDDVENRDWEVEEAQEMGRDAYALQEEPQYNLYAQGNAESTYQFGGIDEGDEDEDGRMEGFWRPQSRW